jgi:hypothetical protein
MLLPDKVWAGRTDFLIGDGRDPSTPDGRSGQTPFATSKRGPFVAMLLRTEILVGFLVNNSRPPPSLFLKSGDFKDR